MDHNGNHVIQKCIEVLEAGDKQAILDRYNGKVLSCAELSLEKLALRGIHIYRLSTFLAIPTAVELSRDFSNIAFNLKLKSF